jgi:DNA-directed RNA polymerase specialized sigma24 family protein
MKVIELAYFQGASSTEISESLDIPVGTVKSRMRRAQEQLALSFVEGGA